MACEMKDVIGLLERAAPSEREQLAAILDGDPKDIGPEAVVSLLWWKYQTPLGFLLKSPSFDEICADVARRLNMGDLVSGHGTCWELLRRVTHRLAEQMKLTPEQTKEMAQEILTHEQFCTTFEGKTVNWSKVSPADVVEVVKDAAGPAQYKLALAATLQVSRALLGRAFVGMGGMALPRLGLFWTGPVGWLLLAWGINDLLGTNYKRVVPVVLLIHCIHERLATQPDADA